MCNARTAECVDLLELDLLIAKRLMRMAVRI
jgi:hypothetical protein